MSRTDVHSPSKIVPSDYVYRLSFSRLTTFEGHAVPPINVPEALALVGPESATPRAEIGEGSRGLWRCDHCGNSAFARGDIYLHVPSNRTVVFGWQCAENLQLAQDRNEFIGLQDDAREATIRQAREALMAENVARFVAQYDGLADALEFDHDLSRDLKRRLRQFGSLSEKQVELAMRLPRQEAEKREREARKATAPDAPVGGRVTVRGYVRALKVVKSAYGTQLKMFVESVEGWSTWGTCPSNLRGSRDEKGVERGDLIEFDAKLDAAKGDPKHSFFSRPTCARIVERAKGDEAAK